MRTSDVLPFRVVFWETGSLSIFDVNEPLVTYTRAIKPGRTQEQILDAVEYIRNDGGALSAVLFYLMGCNHVEV